MRALFDTSVLVAAALKEHPHHARALPWLQRAHSGDIEFLVCAHTFAEMYSALSGLPTRPRISPTQAWSLVQNNLKSAQVIELVSADYASAIQRTAGMGFSGGVIYDALIIRAAEKSRADHILTFNEGHFRRLGSLEATAILVP